MGGIGFEAEQAASVAASEIAFLELFPTPVLRYRLPDHERLNAQIRDVILSRMQRSAGVVATNRGGWHSESDLQEWPEPCVQELVGQVRGALRQLIVRTVREPRAEHLEDWTILAWANVNRKGHYNRPHHHDGYGVMWSSFYYVDTGESYPGEDIGGCTVFQDRSGLPKEVLLDPDLYSREIRVQPQGGVLYLFPSRLYHFVEPYRGERQRITLAFNFKNPAFAIPYYEGMQELDWWWTNFRGLMIARSKVAERLRALLTLRKKLADPLLAGESGLGRLRAAWDHATAEASAGTDMNWGRLLETGKKGR